LEGKEERGSELFCTEGFPLEKKEGGGGARGLRTNFGERGDPCPRRGKKGKKTGREQLA